MRSSSNLIAARLRELFTYDRETGFFRHARPAGRWGRIAAGEVVGTPSHGYLVISVDGRLYGAHILAWLYVTGEWPSHLIDHRDGRRSNNRFDNLRDARRAINQQNLRRARADNRTGVLGVSLQRGRYRAEIKVGSKRLNLGTHDTPEAAHAAYVAAKRRLHAGCTI